MEYNLKIILFLFILLLYYYNNYDSNFNEGYREGDYIDLYTKLLKLDSLNSLDPTRKFDLSFYNYFSLVNEDSVDEYRQIAKENLGSSEERRDDPLLIVVTQEDLETLLWGTSGKGGGTIQCTWWQAQCIPLLQVAIEELKLKPQDFKRPKKVKKDELKDYDQEDYIEALSKDSLDNEIITLYRINLVKLNKLDDDTNYKAVFTSLNQDLNQALSEEMNFDGAGYLQIPLKGLGAKDQYILPVCRRSLVGNTLGNDQSVSAKGGRRIFRVVSVGIRWFIPGRRRG